MGQTGAVGDVFEVGEGFGVGVGDAWTVVLLTEGDEGFGGEVVVLDIGGRGLRDVVILTVEATEVTSCAGEGETLGAGVKVVQRLLFDGVDGEGAGTGVDFADEHAGVVAATAAHTRLTVSNMAVVWAQLTLDRAIVQFLVISTFH